MDISDMIHTAPTPLAPLIPLATWEEGTVDLTSPLSFRSSTCTSVSTETEPVDVGENAQDGSDSLPSRPKRQKTGASTAAKGIRQSALSSPHSLVSRARTSLTPPPSQSPLALSTPTRTLPPKKKKKKGDFPKTPEEVCIEEQGVGWGQMSIADVIWKQWAEEGGISKELGVWGRYPLDKNGAGKSGFLFCDTSWRMNRCGRS